MAPGRVLVVDDEPAMRETLADILGDRGYEVDVARDGREAVERARLCPYAAVLMDVRMPRLNGVEALGELVRQRSVPAGRVLMMTAYAGDELLGEAAAAGVAGIANKPLDLARVLAFVDGACRSTAAGGATG